MDYKYGELENWDDIDVKTGSEYVKLAEGSNVVRIITQPYQFAVCWIKDPEGKPRKLRSALKAECPLIKRGEKLQKRWYVGVIERRSNTAKVLEISTQVMASLKDLAGDEDYGNPKKYDIDIKRGSPGSQPLYRVVPKPPKPLTKEEEVLATKFVENTDLVKMTQPPTPEEVAERLANVEGGSPSVGHQGGARHAGGKPGLDPGLFNFDDNQL